MSKDQIKGIIFKKGSGKYKYKAIIPSETANRPKIVSFGHVDYEQYKDSVPKRQGGGLWTHKNHLDKKRRENYRKRHSKILNKKGKPAFKQKYSPSWFSYHFLW